MADVAFEVDEADPDGGWGWSALVQGPAFDITEAADNYPARLRALDVTPVSTGKPDNWLKITAIPAPPVMARWPGSTFHPPRDRTDGPTDGEPFVASC